MINLKALTVGLLSTLTVGVAPAVALPMGLENHIDGQHYELLESIEEAGANVVINDGECFEGNKKAGYYGFWSGGRQLFVVCTEASRYPGQMTAFSEEDLDTIRHEAIHMTQDLVGDKTLNGRIETIHQINDHFIDWVNESVPPHRMSVVLDYEKSERSAHLPLDSDRHIMNLEAEAEAYAASETAGQINDLVRYWAFGEENGDQVRQTSSSSSSSSSTGSSVGSVVGTVVGTALQFAF
jgi:hypothetical protein